MNAASISKNNAVNMNNVRSEKNTTLVKRFVNYLLDNATYFAVSSAMMTGNSSAAAQIMLNK